MTRSINVTVLAILTLASRVPAQTPSTWTGATGNWNDPTLWSTNPNFPNNGTPPGTTYNVTVNGAGTVTLNVPITIQQLNFQAGTIAGGNSLTTNGLLTWAGGTFQGSGSTTAVGGVAMTGSVGTMSLEGRSLVVGGVTSTWTGNTITVDGGSILSVGFASELVMSGTGSIVRNTGVGTGRFSISGGTVRRQGDSLTTTIGANVTFGNVGGTLDVQMGTVRFDGNGSTTGAYAISAGATIRLQSGFHTFNAGATVTGAGALLVSGGSINLNTPMTFPNLTFQSGTIQGTESLTLSNQFVFSGGTLAGSGTTVTANGGVAFDTGDVVLDGRNLTINGTASTWGTGNISVNNGATLTNSAGSTLTASADRTVNTTAGAGTFINAGILRKQTGTGTTSIGTGVAFSNSGTVDIQSGTFSVADPVTNTGTIQTATGTTFLGTINSGTGGVVKGSGTYGTVGTPATVTMNSGSKVAPGNSVGTLNVVGTTTFNNGSTFEVETSGATSADLLNHSGGTLTFSSGVTLSLINLGGAYNPTQTYTIAQTSGTLDTTGLLLPLNYTVGGPQPGGGVTFSTTGFAAGDQFSLSRVGSTLVLGYTPAPEPVCVAVVLGLGVVAAARRPHRGAARVF